MADLAVSAPDGWRHALAQRSWKDFIAKGGKPGRYPWVLYVLPTAETVISLGDLASCHVFIYRMRAGKVICEGKDVT
jgi:3-methyladenine DNA glycosylase/8-oxoguanine DNA glycosylase